MLAPPTTRIRQRPDHLSSPKTSRRCRSHSASLMRPSSCSFLHASNFFLTCGAPPGPLARGAPITYFHLCPALRASSVSSVGEARLLRALALGLRFAVRRLLARLQGSTTPGPSSPLPSPTFDEAPRREVLGHIASPHDSAVPAPKSRAASEKGGGERRWSPAASLKSNEQPACSSSPSSSPAIASGTASLAYSPPRARLIRLFWRVWPVAQSESAASAASSSFSRPAPSAFLVMSPNWGGGPAA